MSTPTNKKTTRAKVPTEELWEHYKESKSVWRTAEHFGLAGQTVHERLKKNGYKLYGQNFTEDEDEAIRAVYQMSENVRNLNLKNLTKELGRPHHSNVCRRARELGLTSSTRGLTKEQSKAVSKRNKAWIKENGHPKGAKGMKHTPETLEKLSKASKEMWADPDHYLNSEEHRQSLSDRMTKTRAKEMNGGFSNPYSRTKSGWREFDNGKRYFLRSGWEMKYADYLDMLLRGNGIKDWEYETDTFWFEKIKRGVRSYTPDFKVTHLDGEVEYHEVKGWMDQKSRTKLKRMRIYHPEVNVVLIQQEDMKRLGLI